MNGHELSIPTLITVNIERLQSSVGMQACLMDINSGPIRPEDAPGLR